MKTRTHCYRGHAWTPENTYVQANGDRRCRACETGGFGRRTLAERFWSMVDKRSPDDCWLWVGGRTRNGYGLIKVAGTTRYAHRVAVELDGSTIPEGWEVDHTCFNSSCVNPKHLDPCTPGENERRSKANGTSAGEQNKRKTHCPAGHPYSDANLYVSPNGRRSCRTCHNASRRSKVA